MGEFNRALGAEAGGQVVTVEGREYCLGALTAKVKAKYESWLEGRVRQQVIADRTVYPVEVWRELLTATNEGIAAKRYAWGSVAWVESLRTPDGLVQLTRLLLERNHPGLSAEDVQALMQKDETAFGAALNAVLGVRDPNSPAPTESTSPAPSAGG